MFQNAVEAMPEGGTLTVEAEAATAGDWSVVMTDTGTGIPRERCKKIFLPFFTTKDTGVGLGLALVHKISYCPTAAGSKWKSTEGKGTTFHRLVLPTEVTLRRLMDTILVIEDKESMLDMLKQTLEAEGYQVIPAQGRRRGHQEAFRRAHRRWCLPTSSCRRRTASKCSRP